MNKKILIKSFVITFLGALAIVLLILSLVILPEIVSLFFTLFAWFILVWLVVYRYLN